MSGGDMKRFKRLLEFEVGCKTVRIGVHDVDEKALGVTYTRSGARVGHEPRMRPKVELTIGNKSVTYPADEFGSLVDAIVEISEYVDKRHEKLVKKYPDVKVMKKDFRTGELIWTTLEEGKSI
jgi:hypothetical protein